MIMPGAECDACGCELTRQNYGGDEHVCVGLTGLNFQFCRECAPDRIKCDTAIHNAIVEYRRQNEEARQRAKLD